MTVVDGLDVAVAEGLAVVVDGLAVVDGLDVVVEGLVVALGCVLCGCVYVLDGCDTLERLVDGVVLTLVDGE